MLNVRLNVRLTKNPSTRLAGQLAGLRPLLQAVQNEFHTRRNPELVEYLEQVIADDRLLARGWSSRTVAFACYAITLLAAAIALRTVGRSGATVTIFLIAGTMAAALAGIDRLRVASPRAQRSGGDTGGEFFTSK
jgi:hypothetical protein